MTLFVSGQTQSEEVAEALSTFAHEWRPLFISHASVGTPVADVRDRFRDDHGDVKPAFYDNRETLEDQYQVIVTVDKCNECTTVTQDTTCEQHPNANTTEHFQLTELGRTFERVIKQFGEHSSVMCKSVRQLLKGLPDETRANQGEIDMVPPLEEIAENVDVKWNPNPRGLTEYGNDIFNLCKGSQKFRIILPFLPFLTTNLKDIITDEDVISSFVFTQSYLDEASDDHMDMIRRSGRKTSDTSIVTVREKFPYILVIAENGQNTDVLLFATGNYDETVAMCFKTDNNSIVEFADGLYENFVP